MQLILHEINSHWNVLVMEVWMVRSNLEKIA